MGMERTDELINGVCTTRTSRWEIQRRGPSTWSLVNVVLEATGKTMRSAMVPNLFNKMMNKKGWVEQAAKIQAETETFH